MTLQEGSGSRWYRFLIFAFSSTFHGPVISHHYASFKSSSSDVCLFLAHLSRRFFSGTKRRMTLKLCMHHWVLEYYQICSNDDPELTLTYFTARSNLVPYAFVWEKGKTMDFSETIVVYDLKLATDDRSDKKFLLTSKLCSLGAVCPLPHGYIHVKNHEKK